MRRHVTQIRGCAAAPTISHDDQLKSPQALRGGQKFVIDTTIGGVPTPTTSWTRNGQPLMPSAQLTVDVTPTSSKLTIASASADYTGSYVLKAKNAVGATTAEFTITVKGHYTTSVLGVNSRICSQNGCICHRNKMFSSIMHSFHIFYIAFTPFSVYSFCVISAMDV